MTKPTTKPTTKRAILVIDSQNFFTKLEEPFAEKEQWELRNQYNYPKLFKRVFKGVRFDDVIFYAAKIVPHPDTEAQSKRLVERQRQVKRHIMRLGYQYDITGRVRGMKEKGKDGKPQLIFREKGVDVKLAVDVVLFAQQGYQTIYLCSSDSDLQPAITAVRELKGGTEIVYVGFESQPNKGLTYTCNRSVLFRNQEIKDCRR